jgi:putative AdoMet-dependent methyltransferase
VAERDRRYYACGELYKISWRDNMLNNHGFNLWADDYDKSVGISDNKNIYPFAGYKTIMNLIYGTIMKTNRAKVLDIGIGTGVLASKLYAGGHEITGIDFSTEMLNICKSKMPLAELIQQDFSKGLPRSINKEKYNFIISTYALHHLTDEEKTPFIMSLGDILIDNGLIIIGDISFQARNDLENCKRSCGNDWDNEEVYFVFSEIENKLMKKYKLTYNQISYCSGIIEIKKNKDVFYEIFKK